MQAPSHETQAKGKTQGRSYLREALKRKAALWTERSSWDAHWRDIASHNLPRSGRFTSSDRNKGRKRHNDILDNTSIFALRTLSAGMMAGMTSPARPWFRLAIKDRELMASGPVRAWLHDTTELMRAIFAASNTYQVLPPLYAELGAFGTAADFVLPDFDNVIHHYPMTIGEYALATDAKGRVNTIAREVDYTVAMLIEEFGRESCSQTVRNLYDTGKMDEWVTIIQLVQPNKSHDPKALSPKYKKFSSCYFEPARTNWDQFLRETGYDRFVALTPRWQVTGTDVYGHSPGMDALGDVRQLQQEQLRKSQGIDYMVMPPLQVPLAYKDNPGARLPGGMMYADQTTGGVKSAFEVNLDLSALREDIMDVRERIRAAYYADLFLMLANDTRSGITATEVAERHEEKLLALGPVLERLHSELLSPLVDMTFDYCVAANILTPVPPELEGMDLDIEFISTLAQAQKMVASQGVDNVVSRVMNLAQLWPEARHKIDPYQVIDDMGDIYGINPKIIVPDDVARDRAAAEQQAAQAQAAAAQMPAMATAVKDASQIDTANMQDVMSQLQGYSTGAPPAAGG